MDDDSSRYFSDFPAFGSGDSLKRVIALAQKYNFVWEKMKFIHIAGTNGKGSVSSFCTHMLCEAGYKVGWYTSPYLQSFNERIRVLNGREDMDSYDRNGVGGEIEDSDLDRIMSDVRQKALEVVEDGCEQPTIFDVITITALLYFTEQQCDFVVLETGLGGRLDSTNIIRTPLCAIITAPGFDHEAFLGHTMREIMTEKAGIIKEHCPVYAYCPYDAPLQKSDAAAAEAVLQNTCRTRQAKLTFVGKSDFTLLNYGFDGQTFAAADKIYKTKLLGLYQPVHALLAAKALAPYLNDEAIATGIAKTTWPARTEIFPTEPLIILDGAHNPQGAASLAETLEKLVPQRNIVFLAGVLRDKAYQKMLEILLLNKNYTVKAFVATEPSGERRLQASALAAKAAEILRQGFNLAFVNVTDNATMPVAGSVEDPLADEIPPKTSSGGDRIVSDLQVLAEADPTFALQQAQLLAKEHRALIVCFGSLYLAGNIRRTVLSGARDISQNQVCR